MCPECGISCLALESDQDVVNTALILFKKHLPFRLWASHTDSLFPGIVSVLLLIYTLLLVSTAATFVADAFCIKSCNFPGLRFCFH